MQPDFYIVCISNGYGRRVFVGKRPNENRRLWNWPYGRRVFVGKRPNENRRLWNWPIVSETDVWLRISDFQIFHMRMRMQNSNVHILRMGR